MGESNPDADDADGLNRLRNALSRPKRWLRLPEARAAGITLGGIAAANALLVAPAAAQMGNKIGNAICKTGAGKLITGALFVFALLLVYSAIGDFYKGFKQSRSKNTGQRSQQGNAFENAGKKLGGGVVIAALPTILSTIGFSLLSCVKAVKIF
jgi:hypothetical protein